MAREWARIRAWVGEIISKLWASLYRRANGGKRDGQQFVGQNWCAIFMAIPLVDATVFEQGNRGDGKGKCRGTWWFDFC